MLNGSSTAWRRSTATACSACARIAAASSTSRRFSPSALSSTIRPDRSTTTTTRRYNASFAQVGESIKVEEKEEDPSEEEEEPTTTREDETGITEQEAKERIERREAGRKQAHEAFGELCKPFGGGENESNPSSLTPITSDLTGIIEASYYKPSPIYEQEDVPKSPFATAAIPVPQTLEELISKPIDSSSSGPTTKDVSSLIPKRFTIPSASSPESHRTIYKKTWETTYSRMSKAFSKRQLFDLSSQPPSSGGFGIDVYSKETQSKLKLGTKGRKHKWWKSKRLDQMSKRELITTILVGEFELVEPEMVPSLSRGVPKVTEAVPLSDRVLFLLLSPNCPVIPRIAKHLEVKVSFARHPQTQILSLILTGSQAGVSSAKLEIESIDEVSEKRVVRLPKSSRELRPEVYQTVSRLAKTYLEPGEEADTLVASAMEPKYLKRLNRYLSSAFASDSIRQSTSLFASLPTSLSHLRYSLTPFQPLSSSFTPNGLTDLAAGTQGNFARWRTVVSSSSHASNSNSNEEGKGLEEWSERMRMETSSRVPIRVSSSEGEKTVTSMTSSIFQALFKSFESNEANELMKSDGAGEGQYELRAEMGHLVFPIYKDDSIIESSNSTTSKNKGEVGVFSKNNWGWETWIDWLKRKNKNETVWIPTPPKGFLQSTGVLTPLPSSAPESPFSSLFSSNFSYSSSYSSDDKPLSSAEKASLSSHPTFSSTSFRRLIYYPIQLPSSSSKSDSSVPPQPTPPIRLELSLNSEEGIKAELIQESKLDCFVPTGSNDFRLKLIRTRSVSEDEVKLGEGGFELAPGMSLFETILSSPSQNPFELTLNDSSRFFLHTNSLVRQTRITPPVSPPSSSSSSSSPWEGDFPMIQESEKSFLPESGVKAKRVEYLLTRGEKWTKKEIRNGAKEGEGEEEGKKRKGWRTVLEELEGKCR